MNNKTYNIISIQDLNKIDFTQIMETSAETIRKSIDGSKFIIKWIVQPSFLINETVVPLKIYNHAEILTEMSTDAWRSNNELL